MFGTQALDQLSTKIRHKKNYKTNRKDLDGAGVDIHKMIGKLPKPKSGWTLPGHKHTGPYNDLDSQLKYDPLTGEILGSFYEPELLKAKQDIFRIDKVIRRDYKKKQALVKWKGYSDDFNSWIPLTNLRDL